MILIALLIALAAAVTLYLRIPTVATKGYLNCGDIVIIAAALNMGGKAGFLIGGFGSALADLQGYPYFALPTLIIKGLEGWLAGWLGKDCNPYGKWQLQFTGAVLGAAVMVAGYWLAEVFMFGLPLACAELLPNALQGLCGVAGGMLLAKSLNRFSAHG